ncbi:unnamed protein product [Phyllotreta striolata]|uniref:tRNA (32-2'-O)-methyltransferase regulator THADA n=1 Tax=Phyllotreta striolata TaxID=444603 RepID=A0A9N9TF91_PHYSR|nr:unnamed protein product [Phyllotreta striolata]
MSSSSEEDLFGPDLVFVNRPLGIQEGSNLKKILSELEETTKEIDQKKLVKDTVDIYLNSPRDSRENVEARNSLLEFFTRFNSKRVVRKYLTDVVAKNDLINPLVEIKSREILDETKDNLTVDIKAAVDLLNFVTYTQNSSKFNYESLVQHLFPLYYVIYRGIVSHSRWNFEQLKPVIEEIFALLNVVLKQILTVFVKDIPYNTIVSEEYSLNLILLSYGLIQHESIGFDSKTKAGLVLTHSFAVMPEKYIHYFKFKDCPSLELLEEYNGGTFGVLDFQLDPFTEPDEIVIVYASILNVVPKEKLCRIRVGHENLLCILYAGLMELAEKMTSVAHVIVEISRTLSILCKQMKDAPLDSMEKLFVRGISFVWSHIEHFIDTVRSYTKQFFIELIVIAGHHKANGHNSLCEIVMGKIEMLSCKHKSKLLALEYISEHIGCSYLLERCESLPEDLLKVVSMPGVSEEACKCYMALMEKHQQNVDKEAWLNVWISPVTRLSAKCARSAASCQEIITRAFRIYPAVLRKIFTSECTGSVHECRVLLKCLQHARTNGTELSVEDGEKSDSYWRGWIEKGKLENFMFYQDDVVRITVLAVLAECQKSTELFLDWELNFLLKYLRYNVSTQSPCYRMQMSGYYAKALSRFNAGFRAIQRNLSIAVKESRADERFIYEELQKAYKCFVKRFAEFLISNLTFDSNHYRRFISLELLLVVRESDAVDDWLDLWSENDVKNCHSILFDNYEENKKMAAALLDRLPTSAIGFNNIEFTFKYMQQCLNIAMSVKPSKTLSAAYVLRVCANSPYFYEMSVYGLNEDDSNANRFRDSTLNMLVILTGKLVSQTNLAVDVYNPDVANFGLLQSIRYLLQGRDMSVNGESWSGLFEHLVTVCLNMKERIMPIVCDPSPEGFLPDADRAGRRDGDGSAKAQLIVVHAWRTMKEMTQLLGEIVRQTVKLERTTPLRMTSDKLLIDVGAFFVDIFVASKHRGVFEQAYVAFSVICRSFWVSSNPILNRLPEMWLDDALRLCIGETRSEQLCPTRRSAGLPFLILGILSSEPVFDKRRFHDAITTLFKTCENLDSSNDECRMHCMNVLRAMFRHSRLGEFVASYVAQAVIIAVTGFKSDAWGVRNSATLLYAALMTRMFGVQRTQDSDDLCMKNRLTVRVFFVRYPELFRFLLETLREDCGDRTSLLLHPVLMILARLYPSHFEEYNKQMDEYIPHLTTCLSNPAFRTRELAARASVSFIRSEQVLGHLDGLFGTLSNEGINDNQAHGYLLQVMYVLRVNTVQGLDVTVFIERTIHILKSFNNRFSHMTMTLYMEVLFALLQAYPKYEDLETLKTVMRILSKQTASCQAPTTSKSRLAPVRMSLILFIILHKFEETELTYRTVTDQLTHQLHRGDIHAKTYCLNLLVYLNRRHCGLEHPLYKTDDLRTPSDVRSLVDALSKSTIAKLLTNSHEAVKRFLAEELKTGRCVRVEDRAAFYVLFIYYPCVTKRLNANKQETLRALLGACDGRDEEAACSVVCCASAFLLQVDYRVLKYDELIGALMESSSPAASEARRLAVCELLTKNYVLYCNEDRILNDDNLLKVLNIIMVLLEDDDITIRNSMSEFASVLNVRITIGNNSKQPIPGQRWMIIPEKAREDLLTLASIILPKDKAICFLFSWCCRHFPDSSNNDSSEVFESGELNLYAENVSFRGHCNKLLYKLLWTLEDDLSYDDKSIFIEEHALLVTTRLLDSLLKNDSPMMLYKTKESVICVLKSTVKFLERVEVNGNFVGDFRTYLCDTVLGYLTKHVEYSDSFSVEWIIRRIYDPVFIPKAALVRQMSDEL